MKKAGKIFINTIYLAVVLVVLTTALLFVGTKVDLLGYEVKIVKSGSMEPAIHTGSIIVIAPGQTYGIGDVVTYGKDTRSHIPVTHRIVEKRGEGSLATYITKGDANEDKDTKAVGGKDVIGKVAFSIPYLGFVIEFARTPLGFLLLIGLPALLIILDELANIVWEARVYFAKRKRMLRDIQQKKLLAKEDVKKKMVLDLSDYQLQSKQAKRYI